MKKSTVEVVSAKIGSVVSSLVIGSGKVVLEVGKGLTSSINGDSIINIDSVAKEEWMKGKLYVMESRMVADLALEDKINPIKSRIELLSTLKEVRNNIKEGIEVEENTIKEAELRKALNI